MDSFKQSRRANNPNRLPVWLCMVVSLVASIGLPFGMAEPRLVGANEQESWRRRQLQLSPPPQERQVDVNDEECLAHLTMSDTNDDGYVDFVEYRGFLVNLGWTDDQQERLPLPLLNAFNYVACLCLQVEGAGGNCCVGDAAGIDVNRSENDPTYLRLLCHISEHGVMSLRMMTPTTTLEPTDPPTTQAPTGTPTTTGADDAAALVEYSISVEADATNVDATLEQAMDELAGDFWVGRRRLQEQPQSRVVSRTDTACPDVLTDPTVVCQDVVHQVPLEDTTTLQSSIENGGLQMMLDSDSGITILTQAYLAAKTTSQQPSAAPTTAPPDDDDDGLPMGATIAIIIAAVLLLIGACLAVAYVTRARWLSSRVQVEDLIRRASSDDPKERRSSGSDFDFEAGRVPPQQMFTSQKQSGRQQGPPRVITTSFVFKDDDDTLEPAVSPSSTTSGPYPAARDQQAPLPQQQQQSVPASTDISTMQFSGGTAAPTTTTTKTTASDDTSRAVAAAAAIGLAAAAGVASSLGREKDDDESRTSVSATEELEQARTPSSRSLSDSLRSADSSSALEQPTNVKPEPVVEQMQPTPVDNFDIGGEVGSAYKPSYRSAVGPPTVPPGDVKEAPVVVAPAVASASEVSSADSDDSNSKLSAPLPIFEELLAADVMKQQVLGDAASKSANLDCAEWAVARSLSALKKAEASDRLT